MFFTASQLVPLATKFCRQIVPPVVATLIAAVLIAAYNKTFSGHLVQPRMAALHAAENAQSAPAAPITTVGMTKPPVPPAPAVTVMVTIYEEAIEPERLWEKDAKEEAGKDQAPIKLAAEPAPAPVRTVTQAPRAEPKYEPRPDARFEPRTEPHRVAAVELAQPVPVAPVARAPVPVIIAVPPSVVAPPTTAPVVAAMPTQEQRQPQYPPPMVMGTPPMVTVPDKPVARPVEEAQAAEPPRPQGAIGTFVNVFKPSNWFARAREFGEKIEAAGNDILPNIRQQ